MKKNTKNARVFNKSKFFFSDTIESLPKNYIDMNISCIGSPSSGKTTSLLLLFRVLLEYFKVGISGTDYQDFLNLLGFKANRMQGRVPSVLEVVPQNHAYWWQFHDATYNPSNGGYLDIREHGYLSDTDILVACISTKDNETEVNMIWDEILAMYDWIGSNHPKTSVVLLVMLTHIQWNTLPTSEQIEPMVRSAIQSKFPNLLPKLTCFNGIRFFYNPYPLEYLFANPIPEPYRTQVMEIMDWIAQQYSVTISKSSSSSVCSSIYRRLYRVQNSNDFIFSHYNRYSNTQGSNFLTHLPTGQKISVYFLEKDHRYWATEIPNTGKFMLYDAEENKYIQAERISFAPKYLKLENGVVIDTEKKLAGSVMILADHHIFISQDPLSYWDMNQHLALKVAGPKKQFAIYPAGHAVDMELGRIGFYDDSQNILRFPEKRFYHIPSSFYWSIRQLWLARGIASVLIIASFILLGYVFPTFCLYLGFHFHHRQAIHTLINQHAELSEGAVECLVSLMEWTEYHADIEELLSIVDPPVPKSLMQRTHDKNEQTRQLALKIVGKIRSKDTIPLFLDLLKHDPNERIRAISYQSLCYIDPPQSGFYAGIYFSKVQEPKKKRYGILLLTKSKQEEATLLVKDFLHDTDEDIRKTAVEGLIHKKIKNFTLDYLLLMQDPQKKVAQMAMKALCQLFPKHTWLFKQVLQLRSENEQERLKAVRYFVKNPSKYCIPYLEPLLLDHSTQIARECHKLLSQINFKETGLYDNLILLSSKDSDEIRRAIQNLNNLGLPKSVPYLKNMLSSSNSAIRMAAQEAIHTIESQYKVLSLETSLSDKIDIIGHAIRHEFMLLEEGLLAE